MPHWTPKSIENYISEAKMVHNHSQVLTYKLPTIAHVPRCIIDITASKNFRQLERSSGASINTKQELKTKYKKSGNISHILLFDHTYVLLPL